MPENNSHDGGEPVTRKNNVLPFIFLIGASAIWGTTFVTQKLAGYHMGAFTYNAVRFALGALSLIPVFLIYEKSSSSQMRHTFKAGLIGGVVLFIASNLQQFGIVLNKNPGSASEAGFITGLYLIFTPILGIFFGRKASPLTWVACVSGFVGLYIISSGGQGIPEFSISNILILIGSVFWAAHILVIDRFAQSVNPVRFTAVQFAVCCALSSVSAFAFEPVSLGGIADGIFPVLFGGVVACGAAYTFQILGQRRTPPSKAAVIFALEAVFASISEAVWLGEFMSLRKYIGGAIIFFGILLSQLPAKKKDKRPHRVQRK